jgi:hypothetical protein
MTSKAKSGREAMEGEKKRKSGKRKESVYVCERE